MFETLLAPELLKINPLLHGKPLYKRPDFWKKSVEEYAGTEALFFAQKYIDIENHSTFVGLPSLSPYSYYPFQFSAIADFIRINDHRRLNKYFETINSRLIKGGIYVGCAISGTIKKQKIFAAHGKIPGRLFYFIHFLFKRIIPKLPVLKKIYFSITGGKDRMFSESEILGRLVSCGFEILEEKITSERFYFAVQKTSEPLYDLQPTYGPLIRLKRVGKDGNLIKVYKFRTMHPYSEYLQDYIYLKNKLSENGKFRDDFRIARIGRIMRKLWIDELPMIINVLKGEMKIIGVRPLSRHYFNLYPEWLQKKRISTKPGLIPPFYADLPVSFEEIIASEEKYLDSWLKSPLSTDLRYFIKAFSNIIFRNARSS